MVTKKNEKPKVLIADDDATLNGLYKIALEARGYEVWAAFDGNEALEIATKIHPDIIIDDIMMPGMNGIELLDKIKKNKETADIKVLVLTALSDQKLKKEAEAKGADDYIVKSEKTFTDTLDHIKKLID